MKADCHIHMVLDGVDWKQAAGRHQPAPQDDYIHKVLGLYRDLGYTYLRDGGDKWGVCVRAKELAGEYGICYRTPIAPISFAGHYGGFIGNQVENLRDYAALVRQFRRDGADFIKIMISGLMDFDRFGVLSEEGLDGDTIRQMIHIAHAEGLSVMAHANGARIVQAAAEAGVDSVEHGAYLDADALAAMQENGVVWVPTLSTIGNLKMDNGQLCHSEAEHSEGEDKCPQALCKRATAHRAALSESQSPSSMGILRCKHLRMTESTEGIATAAELPRNDRKYEGDPSLTLRMTKGRVKTLPYGMTGKTERKVGAAGEILESALCNVRAFVGMGGLVAPGTDAGAFNVPHGCGTEEGYLRSAGVTDAQMEQGVKAIMERF